LNDQTIAKTKELLITPNSHAGKEFYKFLTYLTREENIEFLNAAIQEFVEQLTKEEQSSSGKV